MFFIAKITLNSSVKLLLGAFPLCGRDVTHVCFAPFQRRVPQPFKRYNIMSILIKIVVFASRR